MHIKTCIQLAHRVKRWSCWSLECEMPAFVVGCHDSWSDDQGLSRDDVPLQYKIFITTIQLQKIWHNQFSLASRLVSLNAVMRVSLRLQKSNII
jgi:hypothetical protein